MAKNSDDDLYKWNDFYDISDEDDISSETSLKLYNTYQDFNERYIEIKEMASGGMKTISRAFDKKTNRYVAIATLKSTESSNFAPFISEARLTAGLQHPNIIKVFDIDYHSGCPYFAMELKLGDSLADIIKMLSGGEGQYSSRYSLKSLIGIFVKVCDAVSYSHSMGVVHLDIKPDNIQVGEHGEVLLCDWGLAKYLGEVYDSKEPLLDQNFLSGQTLDRQIKGTPGFMAPEQILNKSEIGISTDIYSLGALLYNILTFLTPFKGSLDEILQKTVRGDFKAPIAVKEVPSSLDAVVVKAMSVNIADRYSSVYELKKDVSKYLDGYSTSAENSSLLNELHLFYNRNKRVCLTVACSLFLILVIGSIFVSRIQAEKTRAQLSEKRALASEKQAVENYSKYLEEKELADISLGNDPTSVLAKVKEDFLSNYFKDPKKTVDETLSSLRRIEKSNDFEPGLYEFLGDVLFIRQEFDECYKLLQKGFGRDRTNNEPLFVGLEAIEDYKSNGQPAPIPVLAKLIEGLGGDYNMQLLRMLYYDLSVRDHKQEHFQLMKLILKANNPQWDMKNFIYDSLTKTLTLKGEIKRLSIPDYGNSKLNKKYVSILSALEVENLVIRNSRLFRFDAGFGLNLKTLDLQGMRIRFKSQLYGRKLTEKLIVTKSLIQPGHIETIQSRGVEIIFK